MKRNGFAFAGFALLVILLGAIGCGMLWTYFPAYDDEGYILLSAREFSAHGNLYDGVYSQYGPAFYVLTDLLQRVLGEPITHSFARWFTLFLWLGTAVFSARIVARFTGSEGLAFFTAAGTFLYLYFVPGEAFHPGSVVMFALAASVYAVFVFIATDRARTAALTAGVVAAVLLLTKINTGIFYATAVGLWGLHHVAAPRVQRWAGVVTVAVLLVMAAGLMRTLWSEAWVATYLFVFGAGAVALTLVLSVEARFRLRDVAWFPGALTGTAAFILLLIAWRDTSFAALVRGVLLDPIRHAGNYSYGVDWRPGTVIFAAGSLALGVAHRWISRIVSAEAADRLVISLRLAQTAALLVAVALLINARVIGAVFSFVAPSIWIWVVPLHGATEAPGVRSGRQLLALVLLLQYLHAYPIGGIQESWGTFLFFPLVGLGLGEIRRWAGAAPLNRSRWLQIVRAIPVALVAVALVKAGLVAHEVRATHAARIDLRLPGAAHLRLPETQRTAYRILTLNAAVHGDVLFSLPGMFSFNLWADVPPPTGKNTTAWFTLLSERDQRATIAALERAPRACVIAQHDVLALLRDARIPIAGPLHDYLVQNYSAVFQVEGFAFLVRKGRAIAPLNMIRITAREGSSEGGRNRRMILAMVGDRAPIAAMEARALDTGSPVLRVGAENSEVTITPIDRSGNATGEPRRATWPLEVRGLNAVTIDFNPGQTVFPATTTVFHFKSHAGEIIGEARMSH